MRREMDTPLTILCPDRRAIWIVGVKAMGEGRRRRIGDCSQEERVEDKGRYQDVQKPKRPEEENEFHKEEIG